MILLLRHTFFVSCLTLLCSCFGGGCNVIPDTTFHTRLNRATHVGIYSPKGFVYANGGVCGIIVYNSGDGLVAYDRCSTVDPENQTQVGVEDNIMIVDRNTGAKWLLMDGSPTHIAECALRRYSVRKSGDDYIVSN